MNITIMDISISRIINITGGADFSDINIEYGQKGERAW